MGPGELNQLTTLPCQQTAYWVSQDSLQDRGKGVAMPELVVGKKALGHVRNCGYRSSAVVSVLSHGGCHLEHIKTARWWGAIGEISVQLDTAASATVLYHSMLHTEWMEVSEPRVPTQVFPSASSPVNKTWTDRLRNTHHRILGISHFA